MHAGVDSTSEIQNDNQIEALAVANRIVSSEPSMAKATERPLRSEENARRG